MQNTPQDGSPRDDMPQPGGLPPGQAPRQPQSKKWYWIGGGIAAIALCCGCAGIASLAGRSGLSDQRTQIATNQGSKVASNQLGAQSSTPTARASVAQVGQTQTWNGVQMTVTSASPLQPGQYDSIKAGNEYLVVHVKIVNTSDRDFDYNEFDYQILSKAGNATRITFASSYTANDELHSGTLASGGGTVEGDLVFEVTQADHVAAVIWQPNVLGSDAYGWKVTF